MSSCSILLSDLDDSFPSQHHCRACGQLCCGSCSSQRVNLRYLGYIGEQRVCQECYRSLQRTSTRTRSETFTSSRVVLEERMTMSDHLGRPLDKFFFTLTEHTLRWSKKKSDSGRPWNFPYPIATEKIHPKIFY